jgi:hypothetical protein
MGTVVDVIINQGATHRRFTYVARGRNLYKLIKDPKCPVSFKKKPIRNSKWLDTTRGGWGSEVGGGGVGVGGKQTVKVWDNFLCS